MIFLIVGSPLFLFGCWDIGGIFGDQGELIGTTADWVFIGLGIAAFVIALVRESDWWDSILRGG